MDSDRWLISDYTRAFIPCFWSSILVCAWRQVVCMYNSPPPPLLSCLSSRRNVAFGAVEVELESRNTPGQSVVSGFHSCTFSCWLKLPLLLHYPCLSAKGCKSAFSSTPKKIILFSDFFKSHLAKTKQDVHGASAAIATSDDQWVRHTRTHQQTTQSTTVRLWNWRQWA